MIDPAAERKWRGRTFRRRLQIKARKRSRERFWSFYDKETYECPSCGRTSDEARWEVHHKDGDAFNAEMVNLVALCHACHKLTHRIPRTRESLEEWKEQFHDLCAFDPAAELDGQTTLGEYATV